MNCFISELMVPENCDSLIWSCCQNCQYRKGCPYVYDQVLRYAARKGRTAARFLASEADRLQENILHADDISNLIDGDRTLECALSRALCSEMILINDIYAQTAEQSP